MNLVEQRVEECVKNIQKISHHQPILGIVLGSGLGNYANHIQVVKRIRYQDIDGFPVSTVAGHSGAFVLGFHQGVPLILMEGRVHYYEGYSIEEVVLPIRVMARLGIKRLILTNAAGGICPNYQPGDFMLLKDHILWNVPNPLIGENVSRWGERFPDMSNVYSLSLQEKIVSLAQSMKINLHTGTYIQMSGPSYETPAEVIMCGIMGADAVGMSTACEAVAAKHMGLEIVGISCITNMAAGICKKTLSHQEVQEVGKKVEKDFMKLMDGIVGIR